MGKTFPEIHFTNVDATLTSTTNTSAYQQVQTYEFTSDGGFNLNYNDKAPNETITDDAGLIVRDQTVAIKNLWVDKIIVPHEFLIQHGKYYPKYRQDFLQYCKENNIAVNNGPLHEIKFWHSGTWNFDVVTPFWDWYYEQNRELNNNLSPDVVGYSKDYVRQQLKKLKDVLYRGL